MAYSIAMHGHLAGLLERVGGYVFLVDTHISAKLKRDGDIPISTESHPNIFQRALNYLEHDMVRLPT